MDGPFENGQMKSMSMQSAVLLIDDNPAVTRAIEIALRIAGYRLDAAHNPEEAWSRLAQRRYAAILLDMNFTDGAVDGKEGLKCLRRIVADDPDACVIVITAHSGIRIAVSAMQAGARDFVMKPWRNAELIAKIEAAITRKSSQSPGPARPQPSEPAAVMIGESEAMHDLRTLIRRVGPTAANVLITGRPGSGRTLAALSIHGSLTDPTIPISKIDLRRNDYWQQIETVGSTMILSHADHLGPVEQQALADRLPSPNRYITVADRIEPLIPALRRRLATVELAVPPLASRGDDGIMLARHFARVAADRFGKPHTRLTTAAEAIVRATIWTDEVRGLALAIERAVILSDDGLIDAATLAPKPAEPLPASSAEPNYDLSEAERTMIQAALYKHRHNITHAAEALGLSRGALYRRMARYGL